MPGARMACLHLPHFALQLLGRRDPACLQHPAVVVSEDRPHGIVREVNRLARTARIQVGMRYAAALGLCADLRAGVVPPADEQREAETLALQLLAFSPRIEPGEDEPGTLWIDADGLQGLWPDLRQWARQLHEAVTALGWRATLVVGWSRFAVYALARAGVRGAIWRQDGGAGDVVVLDDPQQEAEARDRVPLAMLGVALGLPPQQRDALAMLGIHQLGQLLALPESGLRERHGEAVWRLHRRACDAQTDPLQPLLPQPPLSRHRDLEPPDDQRDRLLFLVKGLLVEVLRLAARQGQAPARLLLLLSLERPHRDRQRRADAAGRAIRPEDGRHLTLAVQAAEPLLDEMQWLDLLRLRLESTQLAARVERLTLQAELVAASAHQLRLWQLLAEAGGAGRRDPEAAAQALARVRAALGDTAVVGAALQAVHLPEAQARWQPLTQLRHPKAPPAGGDPPLLRRLLATPQVLPSRPKHEPDGWLLADWRQGAVTRLWGPFRLSGGWWAREVRRDYWFVQTERGDLLWVFYDQVRRLWYLQGTVD